MIIIPHPERHIPANQAFAFLDRDGLININHGYVHQRQHFQLMPKVIDGLLALQQAGFQLAIVTNQSGIARGFYTEAEFQAFSLWMCRFFAQQGIYFTAVAYCPHHPETGQADYLQPCQCRKPAAGMLWEIIEKYTVDSTKSVMFGDKFIDVQAGINGNIPRQFLVTTELSERQKARGIQSCYIHDFLYSAVQACIAE